MSPINLSPPDLNNSVGGSKKKSNKEDVPDYRSELTWFSFSWTRKKEKSNTNPPTHSTSFLLLLL